MIIASSSFSQGSAGNSSTESPLCCYAEASIQEISCIVRYTHILPLSKCFLRHTFYLIAMVMEITTSMALCSSSPTNFGSTSHVASTCPVMEMDFSARMTTAHNAVSKPAIAGLSALFANSNAWQIASNPCDQLELASSTNSFVRGSFSDSCMTDPLSIASPNLNTKMRERSPVSVLQGPLSYCSGQGSIKPSNNLSLLDRHVGSTTRLCSLTADPQQSYFWQEDCRGLCEMPEEHLGSFSPPQTLAVELPDLSLLSPRQKPEEILRDAQACHEIFLDPFVIKAFHEAEKAHCMQCRATGDLYLEHCVETAMNLAALGASKEVVAAGLLHDVVDDSAADFVELQEDFGKQVADLVEGVSKMSEFSKLARDNDIASKTVEADRLHTMFLAMADVRVVLIKLADRLHNMRTLEALPEPKQLRIAKETLQIFVPLANRLGIWSWKAELEDLCFKHLKPQEHQKLAEKLSGGFRESTIVAAIGKLEKTLLEEGILYHDLSGRRKNMFGIYKKMIRKCKDLEEVHDLQGLRLIVTSKEDCYAALEIVHRLWPQIPNKVKDYIDQPKANGYQSLHTIVQGEDGFPLELQIRTKEMHHQAEFGVAAHWRYKEDNVEHSPFILQMVSWARWMLTWQSEVVETRSRFPFSNCSLETACPFPHHREGCPHLQLLQVLPRKEEDPLFVIILEDEKMVVQELPGGSTVADLLQRRVTEDSFAATCGMAFCEELRPRVNHKVIDNIQQVLVLGWDAHNNGKLLPKDQTKDNFVVMQTRFAPKWVSKYI
ncbi:hypothetical protein GOP47_0018539 [Adiantum capillus-veneris]|uniref:GTP diphosphokinase n=1 Tax=Adiantum capillus-veneris TaxID=13818 RepID=A0A9D4UDL0_ADICA|nr:hypothetical protein GOP47_0018539 [Adiantum capillus-veneris]